MGFNRVPQSNGSSIGSTAQCGEETHRYTVHLHHRHAGTPKPRQKHRMDINTKFSYYYVIFLRVHLSRYFQRAHFIPIGGVGQRGAYYLVYGDEKAAPVTGTTLRPTGLVPADSRQ